MAKILHQLISKLSDYLQGFIHPRCCRISSINSMIYPLINHNRLIPPTHCAPILSVSPSVAPPSTPLWSCYPLATPLWHHVWATQTTPPCNGPTPMECWAWQHLEIEILNFWTLAQGHDFGSFSQLRKMNRDLLYDVFQNIPFRCKISMNSMTAKNKENSSFLDTQNPAIFSHSLAKIAHH